MDGVLGDNNHCPCAARADPCGISRAHDVIVASHVRLPDVCVIQCGVLWYGGLVPPYQPGLWNANRV